MVCRRSATFATASSRIASTLSRKSCVPDAEVELSAMRRVIVGSVTAIEGLKFIRTRIGR